MNEKPIDVETVPAQAVAVRESGEVGKALEPEAIKPPITAAQAKVEAVAALTMSAYEKAATLRLTPEESAALQADFPDEAFQPGAAGKENLIYIEHAHLRDRFTQVFGLGQWAIIPRNRWAEPFKTKPSRDWPQGQDGSRIYVEAMLVVRGCFVGEAVGAMEYYPHNASQNYGDAVEGAKTAAFRRCAKEFGVGLQAWKKEWCEGWWQRKRSSRRPPAATSQPPPPQQSPAAQPSAPKAAAETTRGYMIEQLNAHQPGPDRDVVTEFLINAGIIMPNEAVEDWPLRWVPNSKQQLAELKNAIGTYAKTNGQCAMPYKSNVELETPKTKPIEVPRDKTKPPAQVDEWFMSVIVPIPHKGQKRDEYLQNPDTIGSLFDARHDSSDEGQAARQRLWGFVTNYEPRGWQKRDGTQMPPSESDKKFREALDAFAEWFEKNHPGEKL